MLDALEKFEAAGPYCVRLKLSVAMYRRLTEACETDCRGALLVLQGPVSPSLGGLPVYVDGALEGDQWVEVMSDGTYRAHGFEPTGNRSPVS